MDLSRCLRACDEDPERPIRCCRQLGRFDQRGEAGEIDKDIALQRLATEEIVRDVPGEQARTGSGAQELTPNRGPRGRGELPIRGHGANRIAPCYHPRVLRLIGFFVLALILWQFLQEIPVLGALFRIPFLSFWLVIILMSVGFSKLAAYALDRRKLAALQSSLGATDTPYNNGKLGSLLLAQKRYKRAIPLLEVAADGEPDSAEWHYRLGHARLGAGMLEGAAAALDRAAEIDEEHAYGSVLLRSAEARTRMGQAPEALAMLERFERNHGPNPESAYRRGLALRSLKRGTEARQAFSEVSELATRLAKYQRKGSHGWVLKAALARLG